MFCSPSKLLFPEIKSMPRLLKVLCFALALATSGLLMMSCGSSSNTQMRVVNAIPNPEGTTLDVFVNGTKDFTSVAYDTVYPTPTTPAKYVSVPSGSVTIQAYPTGTTTNGILGGNGTTTSLSGSTQYTLLLAGFLTGSPAPAAYLISDNNTTPTAGNLEIRIINGAASSSPSGGIGVSIYQNGQAPPSPPTTVAFGQASGYNILSFESGVQYNVEVFLQGNLTPLFTYGFTPGGTSTAGSISTLVFVDNPNGTGVFPTPIYLQDLN
jgi:Domain of unknown function (DUF4397)